MAKLDKETKKVLRKYVEKIDKRIAQFENQTTLLNELCDRISLDVEVIEELLNA